MNINDYVLVRLTPSGEQQWAARWRRSFPEGVPEAIQKSQRLSDGRVRFQMHELMNTFGASCYNGSRELPFVNNEVEIPE